MASRAELIDRLRKSLQRPGVSLPSVALPPIVEPPSDFRVQGDEAGFGERLRKKAGESFTFGLYDSNLAEADTFGDKTADVLGNLLGFGGQAALIGMLPGVGALPAIASRGVAGMAGKQALGFVPNLAVRGGTFGGLIGAGEAASSLYQGEGWEQAAKDLGSNIAIGAVGDPILGALGRSLSKSLGPGIRGIFRGADEVVPDENVIAGLLPARSQVLEPEIIMPNQPGPGSNLLPAPVERLGLPEPTPSRYYSNEGMENYLEGYRGSLWERPEFLEQQIAQRHEQGVQSFHNMLGEVGPDVEAQRNVLSDMLRMRTPQSNLEESLARALPEGQAGRTQAHRQGARYAEYLHAVTELKGGQENLLRRAAEAKGYDFDGLVRGMEPETRAEVVADLVHDLRYGIVSGTHEIPPGLLPKTNVVADAAGPVQIEQKIPPKKITTQVHENPAAPDKPEIHREAAQALADATEVAPVNPVRTKAVKSMMDFDREEALLEASLREGTISKKNLADLHPLRKWFSRMTSFMERNLANMGESGGRLSSMLNIYEQRLARRLGEIASQYYDPAKKLLRTKQDWEMARDILRQTWGTKRSAYTGAVPENVEQAVPLLREFFHRAGVEAQAGKLMQLAADGTEIPLRIQSYYFPTIYKEAPLRQALRDPEHPIIKFLVGDGQAANADEAMNMIRAHLNNHFRTTTSKKLSKKVGEFETPFQSWQREQTFRLPAEYEIDPEAALYSYMRGWSKSMSINEMFGQRTLDDLKDEITNIAQVSMDDAELATSIFRKVLGLDKGTTDETVGWVTSTLLNFNVTRNLGLAVIPNMSQTVQTASIAGAKNVAKAIRDITSKESREYALDIAQRAGAIFHPETLAQMYGEMTESGLGLARDSAQAVLKYSGFNAVEQFNQVTAVLSGVHWADDLFRSLQSGNMPNWITTAFKGNGPQRIQRVFKQAGVDVNAALQRGSLTQDEYLKMGQYVLKSTQFPKSFSESFIWQHSPMGRIFYQFQRFTVQQTKFLRDQIGNEAWLWAKSGGKDGTIAPFLLYYSLGSVAGMGVDYLRDSISGADRPEGPVERVIEGLGWVGAFGIFETVIEGLTQGSSRGIAYYGGPSATLATEALKGASGLLTAGQGWAEGDEERVAQGLGRTRDATVRSVLPSFIGNPLSRGRLPFKGDVPALQQMFQPEAYDPTGEKAATKEYRKFVAEMQDAYIEMRITGDPEKYQQVMEDARMKGFYINPQTVNQFSQRPQTQLDIIEGMMKSGQGQQGVLLQQQDFFRNMIEQQNSTPRPVENMLRMQEALP